MEKVRSAGQVVSAQLGEHVSSSTLSAHQMARAGELVDSCGSDVWVRLHDGDTDQSYFWNRRTRETTWRAPLRVEVVWVGELSAGKVLWYWNQVTRLTAYPHPFLGAVLESAVFFPVQFVVGDWEWVGFFWFLVASVVVGVRIDLMLWTSL